MVAFQWRRFGVYSVNIHLIDSGFDIRRRSLDSTGVTLKARPSRFTRLTLSPTVTNPFLSARAEEKISRMNSPSQFTTTTSFCVLLCNLSADLHLWKTQFQNLPRDALPDGMLEKHSTLKRPKKYKTSENDFSHGSFFLRIGGIGENENPEHNIL